jgi:DNA-binding NarL/FixJ family response regulator
MKRDLSARETEILLLLVEGESNRAVAERLGISVRTVEGHRARLMLKLKFKNLVEVVKYAVRNNFIKP